MGKEKPEKVTIYISKKNKEIVHEGRKRGILPSKALTKGYELLMGNAATFNILEKEREEHLKRVSEIENQMDELREGLDDSDNLAMDETIKDLQKAYYRHGELPQQVLETRRVKLGLNSSEMNKLVKEKVIEPIKCGDVDPLRDF